MKVTFVLVLIVVGFIVGYYLRPTAVPYKLTSQERHYCDSLKIDSSVIVKLRSQTDSLLLPFPQNLEEVLDMDIDPDSTKEHIPGFIFNAPSSNSSKIVDTLYNSFRQMGYTVFCLDRNFGYNKKADVIAILRSTDKYQILQQVKTDGINWGIDNDSLISIIKKFDEKYSIDLIGASGDWCEFKIRKEPGSWLRMAKEVNKVCPDVVDQGTGTVEKLAEEMIASRILYFWWD